MLYLEDLQEQGLCIFVDKPAFSYGSDALLLAGFARLKKGERALDLGCGTGILSILLESRTGARFTAVDIQADMCALTRRSIEYNGQQQGVTVLHADLRTLRPGPGFENFDAAVCNPPYFTASGTPSPDIQRRLSRSQDACTLRDAAACAARLLKQGGRLYLCYPLFLFADACAALIENGMQPKRARFVEKRLALIECRKGGGPGLEFEYEG